MKQLQEIHTTKPKSDTVSILMVEDNIDDAVLVSELLGFVRDFQFTASHVQTLAMAITAVETQRFNCILLDMNLPDSTGIDTYKLMRRHALETAIIMLTGQSERDDMMEALRLGADNYLIKGSCDGDRIAIAILSAIRNYPTV